jgi:cytidyltransferase-like protein
LNIYFNEHSAQNLERELPKALIGWYEFNRGKRALFISGGLPEGEVLFEMLQDAGLEVDRIKLQILMETKDKTYDYIIGFGALEKSGDPAAFLSVLKCLLAPSGRILLGLENRLGMRYFVGDKDAFTGNCFDGIDNYFFQDNLNGEKKGRAYTKAEVERMLDSTGFTSRRFYSVMPVLENPRLLFAEDYMPEEELDIRVDAQYRSPDTVFLDEEKLYRTMVENGLFHLMANGYLLEISADGQLSNMLTVTSSLDRGREYAIYTTITRRGTVIKRAAYPEGISRIEQISENNNYLNARGIKTISGTVTDGVYEMPYIKAMTATEYFRKLFWSDKEKFLSELDRFMELVDSSSEIKPYVEVDWEHFEPNWKDSKPDDPNKYKWRNMAFGSEEEQKELGLILRKGYIDLVCLNCFVMDGEFVFYDQEFVIDDLPLKALKSRTVDLIYNLDMDKVLPRKEIQERYGLLKNIDFWRSFEGRFLQSLRNHKALSVYTQRTRVQGQTAALNRNRINFTEAEYDRIFRNIFRDIKGKELYIFGSGRFAERFFSRYSTYMDISAFIDNNEERQGKELSGIKVLSPDILKEKDKDNCKVFICIKRYENVFQQLKDLGVKNISVFNPDADYERPIKIKASDAIVAEGGLESEANEAASKKYAVGYISGVFDLFHVGHVNLLRRAKELCDHLIVGVVTDEQVMNSKKTTPHIPYEQRAAVVAACRYVDEVVMVPPDAPGPEEAYRRYHYDAQFCGSDYADDPYWKGIRNWLRNMNSDLVIFPYTQETSSSKIKELIDKEPG